MHQRSPVLTLKGGSCDWQCPVSRSLGTIRKPGPVAEGCPGRSHSRTFRLGLRYRGGSQERIVGRLLGWI
jgi:hypothetical protein